MNAQRPAFLLDTNVFLESHSRYYAPDICPGFWDALKHCCAQSKLLSIDRVQDEITNNKTLDEWIAQAPGDLFQSSRDAQVVTMYGEIMAWANDKKQFKPEAKAEFARGADGWLVAYAKVHGCRIVTHEAYAPSVRRKVPIPNICEQFNVPHTNTFLMLRELEVCFNWDR